MQGSTFSCGPPLSEFAIKPSMRLVCEHEFRRVRYQVYGTVTNYEKLHNCRALSLRLLSVLELRATGSTERTVRSFLRETARGRNCDDIRFKILRSTKFYELITVSPMHDRMKNLKEKRAPYVGQASALQQARTSMLSAFDLVGLMVECTMDEFKKRRRVLMLQWHPDRAVLWQGDPVVFQRRSVQITSAFAEVERYLQARDNVPKPAAHNS